MNRTRESRRRRALVGRTLQTARHEAAHAVAAELFGIPVTRVELYEKPKRGLIGACHFDRRFNQGRLVHAIIAAAGPVAEHRWHRLPRRWFPTGDAKMLEKAFPAPCDLSLVVASARSLVSRNAKKIDRVARALVKRDLSGAEVRRLLRAR